METVLDGTLYISWSASLVACSALQPSLVCLLKSIAVAPGRRHLFPRSVPLLRATNPIHPTSRTSKIESRQTPAAFHLSKPTHLITHKQTTPASTHAPTRKRNPTSGPVGRFIHSFNELARSLAIRGNRATPAPNEVNVYAQTNRQTRPTLPTRATAQQTAATFSPEHIYTRSLPPPPHHTIPPKHSTRPLLERRR